MNLPLYRDAAAGIPADRRAGHLGLRFQRLFDGFEPDWSVGAETKKDWLKTFAGPVGNPEALTRFAVAQTQLTQALGGQSACFKATGRLVTGTGYPHPVENGFGWHPVLGVPYLPASAVKGLVRAWVEAWLYEATEEPERRARLHAWFGSDHKDPTQRTQEAGTGEILFFDATPIAPVLLKVDIMTPHVGKWYEQGGQIRHPDQEPNRVPADWHDPTPIPFLVAERIELLFTLAPRNTAANSRTELHEVLDCIGNALEWLGAGAKTAIGYGHLEPDSKGDAALAAAVKSACDLTALAKMSPDQQRVHVLRTLLDTDRLINRPNPGGALMQQVAALLTEAHDWASDDREAAAALAEDAYGFHGWGKADKKRQRKQIIAGLRTTS